MFSVLLQLVVTIVLPLGILGYLFRRRYVRPLSKYLELGFGGLFFLLLFFNARWDVLAYPLRFVWSILFIGLAAWVSYKPLDPKAKAETKLQIIGNVIVIGLLAGACGHIIAARNAPPNAVEIASPLRDGTFLVGQGGASPLLNYHYSHKTQRYALDIIGYRTINTTIVRRSNLQNYPIYGATIYSPCSGAVVTTNNTSPNLTPPHTDRKNPSGNHVVIACNGLKILLAHMQQGSITVQADSKVTQGQPIGKVGNSGNTTEPHLHIHAVKASDDIRKGNSIPLTIQGHFYSRNDLIRS